MCERGWGNALKENRKELAQKLYYEQWRYVALYYCQEVYASVVNVNVAVEEDVLGKRLRCGWGEKVRERALLNDRWQLNERENHERDGGSKKIVQRFDLIDGHTCSPALRSINFQKSSQHARLLTRL